MAAYTHEHSNFPLELINVKEYKNVDDYIKGFVNQIQLLREQGYYAEAARMIRTSADMTPYNFDAEDVNRIVEEIRNTQIYAQGQKQAIFYSDTEDFDAKIFDVWIGPTEVA